MSQMKHVRESNNRTDRDHYITMRDISRLRRIVENDEIRLDDNDAISIRLWVTRLRQVGVDVVLKDKRDPAPGNPLPNKNIIPPNQGTWAETAERMGVTRKRKRPTTSPVPLPAKELIGELNRKNVRIKLTDPYSGGVSSGKRAEPDARSAAQNAEARAAAARGASVPSQPKRGRKRAVIPPSAPSPSLVSLPPTPSTSITPYPAIPSVPWYTVHASPSTQAYPVAAAPAAATESGLSQGQGIPVTSTARPPPTVNPAWYPTQPGYPSVYWPYGYFSSPRPQ